MTFDPGRVPDFLEIFAASSPLIRSQEGCLTLELLADVRHANVMMTYSVWSSEEALETYRRSRLFKSTWAKTRPLFAARPEATSFRRHSAAVTD
jgi:quinol monooxygenase YgiN